MFLAKEVWKEKCLSICNNEKVLTNILLEICYNSGNSKMMVWDICGEQIVRNLLVYKDNLYTYCVRDDNGNVEYAGKKYKVVTKVLEIE